MGETGTYNVSLFCPCMRTPEHLTDFGMKNYENDRDWSEAECVPLSDAERDRLVAEHRAACGKRPYLEV